MRGYPVREVSNRLGVSASSSYKWRKLCGGSASKQDAVDHDAETRRLKRDLARVTEERDISKKATASFARESPLSWFAGKPLPGSG